MVRTRRELAVFLSKLNVFSNPSVYLEQYCSDSEVAAILLWKADLNREIEDKIIIDLGAGTGILGIGALLLGAKFVYFIDIDAKMEQEIKKNIEILNNYWEIDVEGKWKFICKDIKEVNMNDFKNDEDMDSDSLIAVLNPPFGTKKKHIDKVFLEKALELTHSIYTMHKTSTKVFIEAFSRDNDLSMAWVEDTSFPIKNTMAGHTKKIERIEVTIYNLRK
ncbi:MAG: METTL5 family protein [Candidatus Woesearchaeota archaeon]